MNPAILKTMLWLRFRLFANAISRLSKINRMVTTILLAIAVLFGIAMFFVALFVGIWGLPTVPPPQLLLLSDFVVLGFLCFWIAGVMTELQRTEPLNLNNFLHLPIKPRNVFLINFLSSLLSLSIVIFAPMMVGFTIALAVRYGPANLASLLLLTIFFLMVTAVTYQFRGWLASLMQNQRKRRTIITLLTLGFILVFQLPALFDLTVFRHFKSAEEEKQKVLVDREAASLERFKSGILTEQQHQQELAEIRERKSELRRQRIDRLTEFAQIANLIVPVGWLPLGVDGMLQGRWAISFLCAVGMFSIAAFSLSRSYETTMRFYRGGAESSANSAKPASDTTSTSLSSEIAPPRDPAAAGGINWLAGRVPGLSEHQSAIAWATLRGMSRAPEVKLAVLVPFIVMIVIGSSFVFGGDGTVPQEFRGLTGLGVCSFAMLGVLQLIQNQLGYDRDGFRALLLAPIRERDILIGKNAGIAPIAGSLGSMGLIALQVFLPMPWTHFVATFFQLGTIYLVTCLVGNLMSIAAPIAVASGSMKAVNLKLGVALLQFLMFFLIPIGILPTVLPFFAEWVCQAIWGWEGVPIYLILAAILFLVTGGAYWVIVGHQGWLLHERRWSILETVTHTKM